MEETIDLAEVIDKDIVDLNLKATSKIEAIEEMIELLVKKGVVSSKQGFLNDVLNREQQAQTGIGNGIAIPHGKSESVIKTTIAVGRSSVDLQWETFDEEPVYNVILFAVRSQDESNVHLKLLAKISGALANENTCQRFKNSKSADDVIQVLEGG